MLSASSFLRSSKIKNKRLFEFNCQQPGEGYITQFIAHLISDVTTNVVQSKVLASIAYINWFISQSLHTRHYLCVAPDPGDAIGGSSIIIILTTATPSSKLNQTVNLINKLAPTTA